MFDIVSDRGSRLAVRLVGGVVRSCRVAWASARSMWCRCMCRLRQSYERLSALKRCAEMPEGVGVLVHTVMSCALTWLASMLPRISGRRRISVLISPISTNSPTRTPRISIRRGNRRRMLCTSILVPVCCVPHVVAHRAAMSCRGGA